MSHPAPSHTGHVRAEHAPGADPHDSHGVGHLVPVKILVATALALIVLTVITVFAANVDFEALEMPELNILVALGIAAVKATLVCLFFMHLKWDRPFNAFVLVASLAFVVLFITFAMTDTSEYQNDVVQQESQLIQGELDKLPAGPLVAPQAAPAGSPAGGAASPPTPPTGSSAGH